VVGKFRERPQVIKQRLHRFHVEQFNHNKLNEVEGKGQYHVEVSNMPAVSEDLTAEVDIHRDWKMIRNNKKCQRKKYNSL
jgi:hypothetical protein